MLLCVCVRVCVVMKILSNNRKVLYSVVYIYSLNTILAGDAPSFPNVTYPLNYEIFIFQKKKCSNTHRQTDIQIPDNFPHKYKKNSPYIVP